MKLVSNESLASSSASELQLATTLEDETDSLFRLPLAELPAACETSHDASAEAETFTVFL